LQFNSNLPNKLDTIITQPTNQPNSHCSYRKSHFYSLHRPNTSSTLLVSSPSRQQQLLPSTTTTSKGRKRSSSLRNQFTQLANRFNKFVSSVNFQIVQRRASFPDTADRLRLYSPAFISRKKTTDSMSSRSHRKVNFNVSEQYEIIDIIGEGAYGVVAYLSLS
jgi:hypothetical protein